MIQRSKKPKPQPRILTREEVIAGLERALAKSDKADFTNATITQSLDLLNLRNADFSNANLKGVDFAGSDVTDTKFRDADLTEANLETVTGLIPEQLLGADLTRCKLPDGVKDFPQLDNVREASKNARAIFPTTVLPCVLVLMTVLSPGDMQPLSNTGTAQLPVLNIPVGTSLFFTIAPVILLTLYVSVQLYLGRLCVLMATLPAVFPDGVPLEQKTYPALLNDLFVFECPRRKKRMGPQVVLYSLIAYLLVPVTVIAIWLRVLPKHDANLSNLVTNFVAASVVIALVAYWTHRRTMLGGRRKWPSSAVLVTPLIVAVIAAGLLFSVQRAVEQGVPLNAFDEQAQMLRDLDIYAGNDSRPETDPEGWRSSDWRGRLEARMQTAEYVLRADPARLEVLEWRAREALGDQARLKHQFRSNRWAMSALQLQPIRVFISFRGDQSRLTKDWAEPKPPNFDSTPEEMAALSRGDRVSYSDRLTGLVEKLRTDVNRAARTVPRVSFVRAGDKLRWPNLRFLDASGAFLVNSDFRGANLTGANFTGADLTGTVWWDDLAQRGPTLTFAQLHSSILTGSDLSRADLTGANLSDATLSVANLAGATLTGANLYRATLTGADLSDAILPWADLRRAKLPWANVSSATLTGADLLGANLTAANLESADLIAAGLQRATLAGADLSYANLTGASLFQAILTGANLSHATFAGANLYEADLTGAHWQSGAEPKFPTGYSFKGSKLYIRKKNGSFSSYRVKPFKNLRDPDTTYLRLTSPRKEAVGTVALNSGR